MDNDFIHGGQNYEYDTWYLISGYKYLEVFNRYLGYEIISDIR